MSGHRVDVRYNYGSAYDPQGTCTCGWTGPQRKLSFRAARDANKHWRTVNDWFEPLTE
jgi:hypothetical protein